MLSVRQEDFNGASQGKLTVTRYADERAWHDAVQQVVEGTSSWTVLSDVPDDNAVLLSIGRRCGTPIPSGFSTPDHTLEDGFVYRIEHWSDEPPTDYDGLSIISGTPEPFYCHTDGYRCDRPPEYVLSLCVRVSEIGGEIAMVDLASALTHLSPDHIEWLRRPVYPSKAGSGPILYGDVHRPYVRFNRAEIDAWRGRMSEGLPSGAEEALRAFTECVESSDVQVRHQPRPGECLVLDNRRTLHARTAFERRSARLIKRLWMVGADGPRWTAVRG